MALSRLTAFAQLTALSWLTALTRLVGVFLIVLRHADHPGRPSLVPARQAAAGDRAAGARPGTPPAAPADITPQLGQAGP